MQKRHFASYFLFFAVSLLIATSMTMFQRVPSAYGQVPSSIHNRTTVPVALDPGKTKAAVASPPPIQAAVGVVAHLLIPSIGVNAPIEPVETNADGSLAVPSVNVWTGVGLYAGGSYPGEIGSAVIDGHLDRPGGWPAVFWKLRWLHAGDSVKVVTPGQPTIQFRVTQVVSYTPSSAPLTAIFGNDTGHFLNLITCSGRWIPAIHQTTHRLVVYTKMVK